jgi:hypothetical protein
MATKMFIPKKVNPHPDLSDTHAFFRAIWKNQIDQDGHFVIFNFSNYNSQSFEMCELGLAAKMAESMANSMDVYFSIGLQGERPPAHERGVEAGVVAIPGFWFDFDLWTPERKKEALRSQYPPDREALLKFMTDCLHDPTILIDTGGGFHAFWILDKPLLISSEEDLKEVKALSKRWQNRIIHYGREMGWNFDNTSSLEHLMRIPGTMNQKYKKLVTRIDQAETYYSLEEIRMLTEENQEAETDWEVQKNPLDPALVKLVNDCAFLKHCDEDASCLLEPHWHMMTCILADQDGGPEMIHQLSRPYPGYNFEETEKKIRNAKKRNPGPITCEHLKTLWDCGTDCKVTCPIHLLKKKITLKSLTKQSVDDEDAELDLETIETAITKEKVPDTGFPWSVFPEQVGACLNDLADTLSVNTDLTGVIGLAVISSAIGSAITYVQAKEDYTVPINIWVGIIGETGNKKTPTLDKMLSPVYEHQKLLFDQASNANATQVAQSQTGKTAAAGNVVKPKNIFTTDPTMEALISMLCENKKGILLYQDELSGFLTGFDKYRKGKGGDREQYLSLWSGTPIKTDRVGKQLYCHRPFVSILGGIQPGKFAAAFGNQSFDDGFLPRFLFYEIPKEKRLLNDHQWAHENKELWKDLIVSFYSLKPESLALNLDKEAWQTFLAEAHSFQNFAEYVPARLKVFIPKIENYILRLSGILHTVNQWTSGTQNISQTIPASTVKGAITLARFFLAQARKMVELYGPRKTTLGRNQEVMIDALLLTMKNFGSNIVAVSDVMGTFNSLVPDEGKIPSDSSFGSLLVKVLRGLKVEYKKARRQKANSGNLAQHVEIPRDSENKLLAIQKTYKF